MSAPSEVSTSASEVSAKELDAIARKKAKDLRYYYKNRERILAAQMVQRREDPEFQERQRVKEEATKEKAVAAQALRETREAEKAREREQLRVERQAAREAAAAAKRVEEKAAREEKRRIQLEEKNELRRVELEKKKQLLQEDQRKRKEAKVREKALALGLCLPPDESRSS